VIVVAGSAENGSAPPPFKWTGPKRRAVELLAADELTDAEVASEVGTAARTLWAWKANVEFSRAVQEAAAALGDLARRYAIGRRTVRLRELDRRRRDLERCRLRVLLAALPSLPETENREPRTENGELPPPDPALFKEVRECSKELREHEKQAAQELGQWVVKGEVTGKDGTPLLPSWEDMAKMPREGLLELYRELARGGQP
jgi:hypothetical protein